ncbi:hypothetical protein B0H63DRAFT_136636 [Podospora didyma]|uniref:Succinate dehydrogenase assembly factor 4, mitochondrial n=1 Tax=Podospora didyma TaxID=330526 RepID=A0AAE0NRN1_9PEZI|nr:hypothetical protein B0H63DRAFT_136636 [Podospora didyma]
MSRLLHSKTPGLPSLFRGAPSTTIAGRRAASSLLQSSPSPPRLPAEQQAEFERLQRAAEASHLTTPAESSSSPFPQTSDNSPLATSRHVTTPAATTQASEEPTTTFSSGIRKGAPPEFEGEKNPKTGEVGGPKNEPLRWGSGGDWSFNGRVTDF